MTLTLVVSSSLILNTTEICGLSLGQVVLQLCLAHGVEDPVADWLKLGENALDTSRHLSSVSGDEHLFHTGNPSHLGVKSRVQKRA